MVMEIFITFIMKNVRHFFMCKLNFIKFYYETNIFLDFLEIWIVGFEPAFVQLIFNNNCCKEYYYISRWM